MGNKVIGDRMSITINLKWLLQLLALVASITYTFYAFQLKINIMEKELASNTSQLRLIKEAHKRESDLKIAELKETLKWYEHEIISIGGIGVNPLSWGKKKNKSTTSP